MRKSKRECIALESIGDTEGLKKAKETLKTRQQALKQYCADNDLKYKPDRTAVVNYKKSVVGFAPVDKKKRIAEIKAKAVDKSGESSIIKENIVIGRSVGAAGKNYPVKLPDGNHSKFAEGSTISKIKVFAGNGTNVPIREAIFLESNYGIQADKWQKVRGEGTVVFEGKNRIAEIHWYEAEGEKIKIKVKRWLDEG